MTENKSMDGQSITMIRHKIVFVGDVYVGKTSIMNRFIDSKFHDTYDVSYITILAINRSGFFL